MYHESAASASSPGNFLVWVRMRAQWTTTRLADSQNRVPGRPQFAVLRSINGTYR